MKKNKFLRLASFMLIACLATCCAVGGTFAKYVTSGNVADSARVAKFGVEITAAADEEAETMFKKEAEAGKVVSTTDAVVAPGTTGTFVGFAITGTPEVAVSLTYAATLTLANWEDVNGDYYCPIKITVGTNDYYGLDYADAAAFKSAVETAIAATSAEYAPNEAVVETLDISWTWAYVSVNGSEVDASDVNDTYLGDQAAAGSAATIKLEVTCTVTQID